MKANGDMIRQKKKWLASWGEKTLVGRMNDWTNKKGRCWIHFSNRSSCMFLISIGHTCHFGVSFTLLIPNVLLYFVSTNLSALLTLLSVLASVVSKGSNDWNSKTTIFKHSNHSCRLANPKWPQHKRYLFPLLINCSTRSHHSIIFALFYPATRR